MCGANDSHRGDTHEIRELASQVQKRTTVEETLQELQVCLSILVHALTDSEQDIFCFSTGVYEARKFFREQKLTSSALRGASQSRVGGQLDARQDIVPAKPTVLA